MVVPRERERERERRLRNGVVVVECKSGTQPRGEWCGRLCFKGSVQSKMKFHVTVGHTTVMATVWVGEGGRGGEGR